MGHPRCSDNKDNVEPEIDIVCDRECCGCVFCIPDAYVVLQECVPWDGIVVHSITALRSHYCEQQKAFGIRATWAAHGLYRVVQPTVEVIVMLINYCTIMVSPPNDNIHPLCCMQHDP